MVSEHLVTLHMNSPVNNKPAVFYHPWALDVPAFIVSMVKNAKALAQMWTAHWERYFSCRENIFHLNDLKHLALLFCLFRPSMQQCSMIEFPPLAGQNRDPKTESLLLLFHLLWNCFGTQRTWTCLPGPSTTSQSSMYDEHNTVNNPTNNPKYSAMNTQHRLSSPIVFHHNKCLFPIKNHQFTNYPYPSCMVYFPTFGLTFIGFSCSYIYSLAYCNCFNQKKTPLFRLWPFWRSPLLDARRLGWSFGSLCPGTGPGHLWELGDVRKILGEANQPAKTRAKCQSKEGIFFVWVPGRW